MHIPTRSQSGFCPLKAASSLLQKRDLEDTAKAFKSWDTCMDDILCKVIAIAGIAIGALIVLWVFIAVVRCCQFGISTLSACCFCCCSDRHHSMDAPQLRNQSPSRPTSYQRTFQPAYHHGSSTFGGGTIEEDEEPLRSRPSPPPLGMNRAGTPSHSSMQKHSPPPDYDHSNNDYSWGYAGNHGDRRPWETEQKQRPIDNTQSMEMEPYEQPHPYRQDPNFMHRPQQNPHPSPQRLHFQPQPQPQGILNNGAGAVPVPPPAGSSVIGMPPAGAPPPVRGRASPAPSQQRPQSPYGQFGQATAVAPPSHQVAANPYEQFAQQQQQQPNQAQHNNQYPPPNHF